MRERGWTILGERRERKREYTDKHESVKKEVRLRVPS